jgi:hypothetical protein
MERVLILALSTEIKRMRTLEKRNLKTGDHSAHESNCRPALGPLYVVLFFKLDWTRLEIRRSIHESTEKVLERENELMQNF